MPSFGLKVAVLVPMHDQVMGGFAVDLANAVATSAVMSPHEWTVIPKIGTNVPAARNWLVERALEWGADRVVWVDADMRFPADSFLRLLDVPADIAAVNASRRVEPIGPIAAVKVKDGIRRLNIDQKEGRAEVDIVGFGMVAMDADVFRRISKPWFHLHWVPETEKHVGSDVWFCSRARNAGLKIVVDRELSEEIGHTGYRDYFLEDCRGD